MGKVNYIDLFCGVGGFRHALNSPNTRCVFSSDIDPDARLIYGQNWGEIPAGDISQVEVAEIPAHDVLCGGFPCQPFSISGNQGGFEDARGTLLHEILRIARHHQPRVLFLENVKNFLGHADGKTLATTLRLLNQVGYDVHYSLLNASYYGVAQKRERVYFVCFRKDLGITDFQFPKPSDEDVAVEDIVLPGNDPRLDDLIIERTDLRMKENLPADRENRTLRIGTVGKGGQGERVYSPKGHAITLSAFGGGIGAKTGMYLMDGKIRRLHPEECRRLMGFPDGFKLHDRPNVSYKQFGNSVAVPVVRKIFQSTLHALTAATRQAA
ncbi:MAG: DNA cytosine methyltransferase [Opitutales bacterium]|nr:DNA cytosine methyltransferase [Opitutales bacterium]